MNKTIFLLLIVMALSLPLRVQAAVITADGFNIYSSGSVTIRGGGVKAMAVQPWDRKIIIGGSFTVTSAGPSPASRSNLARLNFDGSLDTGFTAEADGPVHAIAIQLDNANPEQPAKNPILVGGGFTSLTWAPPLGGVTEHPNRKGVARLSAVDGQPDGFDPGTGNGSTVVNAIAVDAGSGSIVLGGSFSEMALSLCSNIAKLSSSGVFQSGFSGGVSGGEVLALVALEGRRTLAAGSFSSLVADSVDQKHGYLVKFDADGVRDPSFTPAPSGTVRALALQPDGSLILGGDFTSVKAANFPLPQGRPHLARVDGDGLLDDFNPGIGGPAASVAAVAMQPDGKILIGGVFDSILHPAGAPADGEVAATRKGAARLRLNGAVEEGIDPAPDAAVSAIAVQPDGKFLIAGSFAKVLANDGAGGKPRSRLARFYPYGALDQDVYPIGKTMTAPDLMEFESLYTDDFGRITFSTEDPFSISGVPFGRFYRLGANFTGVERFSFLDDLDNMQPHYYRGAVWGYSPAMDGRLLITGGGQATAREMDQDFNFDPNTPFNVNFVNDASWANLELSILHLPDDKMYIGGIFSQDPRSDWPYPGRNVRRVYRDGTTDTSFNSPMMDGQACTLALQPDPKYGHKLLVAGRTKMLRLLPDGTPDPLFVSTPLPPGVIDSMPTGLVLRPDGKILVVGRFESRITVGGTTWYRHILLLNSDGTIDGSWRIDNWRNDGVLNDDFGIFAVHLQTDGKAIVTGGWDLIMDIRGLPYLARGKVARLDQNGLLDDLDLGTFEPARPDDQNYVLKSSLLLPDGKLVVAGEFNSINGDTNRRYMARFAIGSASEVLSVSPDGQQVTWKRGGVAPEASRVYFEWSPDGSDNSWQPLGWGDRIEGGWKLDYDLGQHGWNQNRYLRASAQLNEGNWVQPIHRAVLLYYLRPELTVQGKGVTRDYGSDNPPLVVEYRQKGAAVPPPLSVSGAAQLSTAATKTSSVGDYRIEVDLGRLSSWRYRFAPGVGYLTVQPLVVTVTADPQYKQLGAPDPVLTYQPSPVPPDSFSGALSWDHVDSAGPHDITQGTLKLSDNYDLRFKKNVLTVYQPGNLLTQTIDFKSLPEKTYGDSDFDPGATASSGLPVSYDILNLTDGLATLTGGRISVHSPGTDDGYANITASQGGDPYYAPVTGPTRQLTVHPAPGKALSFDGADDLLRIADAPQLNFGAKQGYTVEAWLQLNGHQPDGTGVLAKATSGAAWRGFQLLLNQDRLSAELSDGASTVGAAAGLRGGTSLNDGFWHHVALSVDRAARTAILYLDGREEARVTDPHLGSDPDSSEPLLVGVERGGVLHFRGSLDELRVWETARSADQIRGAAGLILDPPTEHLMAYYHFDEGRAWEDNAGVVRAPERTANGVNGNDALLSGFALSGDESNWVPSGALIPLVDTRSFVRRADGFGTGDGFVYRNLFPITDRGICWDTVPIATMSDHCSRSATKGEGAFTAVTWEVLDPDVTYYARAYATNNVAIAYGPLLVWPPVAQGKLEQKITFQLAAKTYGDPEFPAGGWSDSGLTVSYASSNQSVAVIVGGSIRIVGAGVARITASQGGNEKYNRAPDVTCTLNVAQASVTVSAEYKARAFLTPNPQLTASYRGFVNGEGPSVVSGSPVLSTAATLESPVGDYDISIDVAPLVSRNYRFSGVKGILSVVKSCQQIIFPRIGEKTYGDPAFELIAYSCSGLPIGFTSSNPQSARVQGNLVTITGAGSAVITASQPGSGDTERAPDVSQTLLVHRSRQELSFPEPPRKVLGDAPFPLSASASSGLPVSYQSSDPAVAVVSGNLASIVGPGTAVVTANQEGDANFDPALPVSRPLTVAAEGDPPALAVSTLASGSVTANPVLNVSGSAGDPSGIASLAVNDRELAQEAALFSTALPLKNGENSIKVTATDGAGNKQSREIGVTFDAAAPLVQLAEPADNTVTDASSFRVTGTAAKGSSVALSVNGGAAQTAQITDGAFSASGYLQEGLNTIEVTAELAGRSSTVKRSVTLSFNKPYLAITDPPQDLRTEKESITIAGVAGGRRGAVTLEIGADGGSVTIPLQEGGFRREIQLHEGENRVRATVTDGSGSSSTASRNVLRYQRVLGDLNGDGLVDVRDVLIALRMSLGIEPVTPEALSHGDVAPLVDEVPRPDGRIDVGDVLVLLRKVVGLVEF